MDPLTEALNTLVSLVQEHYGPAADGRLRVFRASPAEQAVRMLARYGRLKIVHDAGGEVHAEWIRGGQA